MSVSRKAQLTTEFVIIMIAVLLIFSILFQIYMNRQIESRGLREQVAAERITEQVAWSINAVYLGGTGSSTEVYVPELLLGRRNFTLSVDDSLVYLFWESGFYSYPLVTSYIFYDGNLTNRTLSISNLHGGVYIE